MQEEYVIGFKNSARERKIKLMVSVMCLHMREEDILLSGLMPNVKWLYLWPNYWSLCTYIIMHETNAQWQLHLTLQPFTMFSLWRAIWFPQKYGPCCDGFHPWLDELLICIPCKFDTEALVGLRHLQASFLHPWANHGLWFFFLEGGIRWWARVIPYNGRFCWGIKGFIIVTWWWVTIEA